MGREFEHSSSKLNIVHLAPHFGGGIAPAIVGIAEAINASHYLVEIELTQDLASKNLLASRHLQSNSIVEKISQEKLSSADSVILHYWGSYDWSCLLTYNKLYIQAPPILLNHRALHVNYHQMAFLGNHIETVVQSGFNQDLLRDNWFCVPTCRTLQHQNQFGEKSPHKATYVGTLSYKKASVDFFRYVTLLNQSKISVDVWGSGNDASFSANLITFPSSSFHFRGYAVDTYKVLPNYTFFLYPLRPLHYGTTENTLIEAMNAGLVPIVKNNAAERAILGQDLMSITCVDDPDILNETNFLHDATLIHELSEASKRRARFISDVSHRMSVWMNVLSKNLEANHAMNLSELGQLLFSARRYEVK